MIFRKLRFGVFFLILMFFYGISCDGGGGGLTAILERAVPPGCKTRVFFQNPLTWSQEFKLSLPASGDLVNPTVSEVRLVSYAKIQSFNRGLITAFGPWDINHSSIYVDTTFFDQDTLVIPFAYNLPVSGAELKIKVGKSALLFERADGSTKVQEDEVSLVYFYTPGMGGAAVLESATMRAPNFFESLIRVFFPIWGLFYRPTIAEGDQVIRVIPHQSLDFTFSEQMYSFSYLSSYPYYRWVPNLDHNDPKTISLATLGHVPDPNTIIDFSVLSTDKWNTGIPPTRSVNYSPLARKITTENGCSSKTSYEYVSHHYRYLTSSVAIVQPLIGDYGTLSSNFPYLLDTLSGSADIVVKADPQVKVVYAYLFEVKDGNIAIDPYPGQFQIAYSNRATEDANFKYFHFHLSLSGQEAERVKLIVTPNLHLLFPQLEENRDEIQFYYIPPAPSRGNSFPYSTDSHWQGIDLDMGIELWPLPRIRVKDAFSLYDYGDATDATIKCRVQSGILNGIDFADLNEVIDDCIQTNSVADTQKAMISGQFPLQALTGYLEERYQFYSKLVNSCPKDGCEPLFESDPISRLPILDEHIALTGKSSGIRLYPITYSLAFPDLDLKVNGIDSFGVKFAKAPLKFSSHYYYYINTSIFPKSLATRIENILAALGCDRRVNRPEDRPGHVYCDIFAHGTVSASAKIDAEIDFKLEYGTPDLPFFLEASNYASVATEFKAYLDEGESKIIANTPYEWRGYKIHSKILKTEISASDLSFSQSDRVCPMLDSIKTATGLINDAIELYNEVENQAIPPLFVPDFGCDSRILEELNQVINDSFEIPNKNIKLEVKDDDEAWITTDGDGTALSIYNTVATIIDNLFVQTILTGAGAAAADADWRNLTITSYQPTVTYMDARNPESACMCENSVCKDVNGVACTAASVSCSMCSTRYNWRIGYMPQPKVTRANIH